MSSHEHVSLHISTIIILVLFHLPGLPAPPVLPQPDPAAIQTQNFLPAPSPPATIPAFPEQSNVEGCPLDLPEELFHNIKPACHSGSKRHHLDPNSPAGLVHKTRCCPVLAAWLYSAYSKTALNGAIKSNKTPLETSPVDMPVLPDDSETCLGSLEKELNTKGIDLFKPNETCDAVYCYCGIRLHPFSCPQAFYVNQKGFLAGGDGVKKLERDCLSKNPNGYGGLGGCSKCLNSLYLLSENRTGNISRSEDGRSTKMRSRDCELMGLTWLLNKSRSAYIHTVSAVLRAFMVSPDGSDPLSCTLDGDGMPLAVDSSEISDQSSANVLRRSSLRLLLLLLALLCASFSVSLPNYY